MLTEWGDGRGLERLHGVHDQRRDRRRKLAAQQHGGIRAFPYDSSYPDNFSKLGTGRYMEVHKVGEIWCATLMEMNRRTDRFFAVQLIIDALKLTPANPSLLDARDAIFRIRGMEASVSESGR
jgi:Fungalysin metallopeptidase (M36)